MAKRKPASKSGATPSVGELTRRVGSLQRELVKSLTEYAKASESLLRARVAQGDASIDMESEQRLLGEALEGNRGPLSDRCLHAVLRELRSGIRAAVKLQRVAYLGPMYSYSHLAAIERFGTLAELVPVATISAVFEELNRAHVDFGIVPIENSTDGRVVDTLGMFTRLPMRICGEVQLRIHHHLLGRGDRADVKEVYSKPQALSQCREWLAKHVPQARLVEMTSTAAAAQLAADKPGAAAIASVHAAVNYGLNVLAEKIEDNRYNVTRFAVISDHDGRRTGKDKTALMFEITHTPGALADATAVFKRNRLNLTWIESFPLPGSPNEYLFFVELEGHHQDARVKRALADMQRKTQRLEVLGSYARAELVEAP